MHIITKAMKLFYLPLVCLIILPSLFAFQQHDQNLGYTHPAIVVSGGVSYISVQTVPAGTPITSTSYWTPLLNTAPTDEPGDPPTTEPDTSDSDLGNLTPPEDNSESKLSNISTRGYVGTDDSRMIAGFIVTGSGSTTVTIRALGQTIADAPYNVVGTISDPKLTIVGPTGVIASSDNWQDGSSASDIQSAGRAPKYANEAAVQISVEQGNYTAIVQGAGGATGVALVEVYDEGTGGSTVELSNLSTRAFTGTGDSRMIAGFIVGGETGSSSTVTIRALGPTIADEPYNVEGTISDPKLIIVGPSGVIATVDNWEQSTSAQNIISSSRIPKYTFESAHQLVVGPGNYTAIVQGNNETGISLVEVYKE